MGVSGKATKVAKATLLLLICVLALTAISSVMAPKPSVPRKKGKIAIEIYWNQQATDKVSSIDFGMLEPGSSKNVTCYIRNGGKKEVSLSLNTSNWNPSKASDYLSLKWDYDGQLINSREIVQVTFTLSVSTSIEGIETFSFDITITASPIRP